LIWGIFFHSIFKTPQVKLKTTVTIFFLTQLVIFLSVDVLRLTAINPLYRLIESSSFLPRLVGFIAGVGVFEEAVKALPLFFICYRAKGPILPQTAVFYGLISGIGFGVFEGVGYQLSVNAKLDYNNSFFLNIARLTSLPFLHAIWSGIAGYFVALSVLYPKSRQPLWVLAIAIPAMLHGLYDTLGWSIPGLAISYIGVALLIVYLQKAKDFGGRMLP
jgi:RsiW-degrading membrane proteinase PrsW (M82 family)